MQVSPQIPLATFDPFSIVNDAVENKQFLKEIYQFESFRKAIEKIAGQILNDIRGLARRERTEVTGLGTINRERIQLWILEILWKELAQGARQYALETLMNNMEAPEQDGQGNALVWNQVPPQWEPTCEECYAFFDIPIPNGSSAQQELKRLKEKYLKNKRRRLRRALKKEKDPSEKEPDTYDLVDILKSGDEAPKRRLRSKDTLTSSPGSPFITNPLF
jgi:hypothetical protein